MFPGISTARPRHFRRCGFTQTQWTRLCVSLCRQMASGRPFIPYHFFASPSDSIAVSQHFQAETFSGRTLSCTLLCSAVCPCILHLGLKCSLFSYVVRCSAHIACFFYTCCVWLILGVLLILFLHCFCLCCCCSRCCMWKEKAKGTNRLAELAVRCTCTVSSAKR